ncbi:uncharacterized protein LOC116174679 isoform X1 [Photinus pyralis]|uniref:uncharacterized protein LOC116174679 isoform X1 n=1 Tax=Photinus pyralis TaxID=7054 RepID=UPI0012674CC5|nr:uncharacterized protein LOC116174679 isoform X1 [Photinus pyralis]
MNFVELINDLEGTLTSSNYVEHLWCKIREVIPTISISLEDEEVYRNHLPLDLTKFLKKSVFKLRDMKNVSQPEVWNDLDPKYISTLVYFVLEQEDVTMQNALYVANIFVLLNVIPMTQKQHFYKVTYLKILEMLGEFNRSQDLTCNSIIFLMDDFKTMLMNTCIPEETVIATIAVLHSYTYCCNETFKTFDVDISFENLGYLAFVSLKVLAEQLQQQKNNDRKLFPILLCLMSCLKSSSVRDRSRSVKTAHLNNVQQFLKETFELFQSRTFSLITDALKTISLSREYDNFDDIAKVLQQLPSDVNQVFQTFFVETLLCNKDEFKLNLLNLVIPILRHPPEYETISKRVVKAEVLLYNVIMLFADKNEATRENALKVVAEFSEDSLGRRVLRKLMASDNYGDVNKDSIQDVLYNHIDQNWNKKNVNVYYIQLICNLFIIRRDLVTIKGLNRLRNICLNGSPYDLKPCIIYFKRLLEYHSCDNNVVLYILSIFVKQMFHSMATSTLFAKELHAQIFSNITVSDHSFVWNIVNYLVSHNFDVLSIFERFHSLQLLSQNTIRILMEYKIHEGQSRTPALKLLCVMLNFIPYDNCHLLEEILEDWLISGTRPMQQRRPHKRNGNHLNISPTDLCFVLCALTKIMQTKRRCDCTQSELDNYRQMHYLTSQAFFEQVFPIVCVNYAITLLAVYSDLINEDVAWDRLGCTQFEETLVTKLNEVYGCSLQHHTYLLRDVAYLGDLIILRKVKLSDNAFSVLRKIATAAEHTKEFTDYLKTHSEIWNTCLLLYIKACFINTQLSEVCVQNLEYILSTKLIEEYSKLQLVYALYDICSTHFQYYDPLVPFLFECLNDTNAYIRFICSKIIMRLINEEQLRLMDGNYFIFMSLLADAKDIVSQNVETFIKESYIKKNYQTVAGQYVACLVHYNFCYTHPVVSLSKNDCNILKSKNYSSSDRHEIYYCLYQYLPDNTKLNVLNVISTEILGRILNESLPHSPETMRILEDALSTILYMVPKSSIPTIGEGTSFYDDEVKYIHNHLMIPLPKSQEYRHKEKNSTLKSLCKLLLQIFYSKLKEDPKVCQNILFTISVLRNTFELNIRHIISEDTELKDLFESLKKFYQKHRQQFQYLALSIGPKNWLKSFGKEDVVFYWQNMPDFTYIPPCKILRGGNLQ